MKEIEKSGVFLSSLHLYRNAVGTVQFFVLLEPKFDFLGHFAYYILLLVNIEFFWRCCTPWLTFCWFLSVFLVYLSIIFLFCCVWIIRKKWSVERLKRILNNGKWSDLSTYVYECGGSSMQKYLLSNAGFLQSTAWLNLKGPSWFWHFISCDCLRCSVCET